MPTIQFSQAALDQFEQWVGTNQRMAAKIMKLLQEVSRTPFEGTGQPEPLKYELSGYWSRRINQEHRLVYRVEDETVTVISCMFHYDE
jgi:toxin YoeB